jgi:hypothetical protein
MIFLSSQILFKSKLQRKRYVPQATQDTVTVLFVEAINVGLETLVNFQA